MLEQESKRPLPRDLAGTGTSMDWLSPPQRIAQEAAACWKGKGRLRAAETLLLFLLIQARSAIMDSAAAAAAAATVATADAAAAAAARFALRFLTPRFSLPEIQIAGSPSQKKKKKRFCSLPRQ